MNAFWWVVAEIWTSEKFAYKTLTQCDVNAKANADDPGDYNSSPCTSYRQAKNASKEGGIMHLPGQRLSWKQFIEYSCARAEESIYLMSLVTRKPVFGVCDQVRLEPACAATEASLRLEISDIETGDIILSRQQTKKVLIRLRRLICTFVVRIWHKQVFSWHGSNMNTVL